MGFRFTTYIGQATMADRAPAAGGDRGGFRGGFGDRGRGGRGRGRGRGRGGRGGGRGKEDKEWIPVTYAAVAATYAYLTPDLWKETIFQKSPYQEFTDYL